MRVRVRVRVRVSGQGEGEGEGEGWMRQEALLAIGDGGGALDHHLVHGAAVVRLRVRVRVRV